MMHNKDTKLEKISFRVEKNVVDMLDIIVKNTNFNKCDISRKFFLLGVNRGLSFYLNPNLIHWKFGIIPIDEIIEGIPLKDLINKVIQLNKFKKEEEE